MRIDRPISTAIILFLVLILSFFWVAPKYKSLKALELDLAQKEAEYKAQFDYYSEVTSKYHEIKSRDSDIKKIDDALPEEASFGQLAYYFQKQAKNNGLILKSISLAGSSSGTIKSSIFSLNLSGDYLSLENFIVSLEKSAKLFEVTGISFTSTSAPVQQVEVSESGEEQELAQFQSLGIFSFSLEVKTFSY